MGRCTTWRTCQCPPKTYPRRRPLAHRFFIMFIWTRTNNMGKYWPRMSFFVLLRRCATHMGAAKRRTLTLNDADASANINSPTGVMDRLICLKFYGIGHYENIFQLDPFAQVHTLLQNLSKLTKIKKQPLGCENMDRALKISCKPQTKT